MSQVSFFDSYWLTPSSSRDKKRDFVNRNSGQTATDARFTSIGSCRSLNPRLTDSLGAAHHHHQSTIIEETKAAPRATERKGITHKHGHNDRLCLYIHAECALTDGSSSWWEIMPHSFVFVFFFFPTQRERKEGIIAIIFWLSLSFEMSAIPVRMDGSHRRDGIKGSKSFFFFPFFSDKKGKNGKED